MTNNSTLTLFFSTNSLFRSMENETQKNGFKGVNRKGFIGFYQTLQLT